MRIVNETITKVGHRRFVSLFSSHLLSVLISFLSFVSGIRAIESCRKRNSAMKKYERIFRRLDNIEESKYNTIIINLSKISAFFNSIEKKFCNIFPSFQFKIKILLIKI